MKYRWKLKDIILVAIISVIFAIFYLGIVYFATFLSGILAPWGLSPLAFEFVFGCWFMAGTMASYILRKPGVGLVSEMLAAFIEVLMGNMYGPMVFIAGFIQGTGTELGFAVFKYKRFTWSSMLLASSFSAILSFAWGFVVSGFFEIKPAFLLLMLLTRIVSALLFSGVITKILADRLARSGVLKGYAIGQTQLIEPSELSLESDLADFAQE